MSTGVDTKLAYIKCRNENKIAWPVPQIGHRYVRTRAYCIYRLDDI